MDDEPDARAAAPVPGARALGPGTPRVAALDALLREIDGLRLALETDLTLAAGALEAGSPELAAQLVAGDQRDLVDFEQRALGHLRDLEAADVAAAQPRPSALSTRRTRRLARLLPAAPLVAAAAAVVALLGGMPGGSSSTGPDVTSAALSSWEELDRLTRTGASAHDVAEAARDLNADIVTLLASSDGDPATTRRALALLQGAQLALAADDDADQLQGVLAQSRALALQLAAALPSPTSPSGLLPSLPPLPSLGLPAPAASLLRRLPTALPSARPSIRLSLPPRSTPRPAPAPERTSPAPSVTPTPRPTAVRSTPTPSARPSYPAPTLFPSELGAGF
ncbi:MAG: hypothetical protein JWM64_1941 [Frankiales bacterium]|nr:hypothetical protein [Frankiales bacterium]